MKNLETKTVKRMFPSVKIQLLATVLAIVGAVALPQIFHLAGTFSGLGSRFGEILLPMHLPVILASLLAGPLVGLASGALAPLVSFALSGMPGIGMLPFIMIELAVYGISAGLLRSAKMPVTIKVLAVQVVGRLVRAAAIAIAVYAFGYQGIKIAVIWNSILVGLPGIALQLILIPLIIYRIDSRRKK